MLEPVSRERLAEGITEQLGRLIISGDYPAGEKLPPERVLAEMLSVTRTPVREALRQLEQMGLVRTRVGDGTYVQDYRKTGNLHLLKFMVSRGIPLDEEIIRSVKEFRAIYAEVMVRTAVERMDERTLDELERMVESFPSRLTPELLSGDWDFRFWLRAMEGTGNIAFLFMMNTVAYFYSLLGSAYRNREDSLHEIANLNRQLVEAFKARDAGKALEILHERQEFFGFLDSREEVIPRAVDSALSVGDAG